MEENEKTVKINIHIFKRYVTLAPLFEALQDENGEVAYEAVIALAKKGQIALTLLMDIIQNPDPTIRARAVKALGMIKEPQTKKSLIAVMVDPDPNVRYEGCVALGNFKNQDLIEVLLKRVRDKDASVRWAAAVSLDEIFTSHIEDNFSALLNVNDTSVTVMATIARGELEDIDAIRDDLPAIVNNYTRRKALSELLKTGSYNMMMLIAALQDKDVEIRIHVAEALGNMKVRTLALPLIEALQDESYKVRNTAARSLGHIKDARAVKSLIDVLRQDESYNAAWALGEIGDSRAIDALIYAYAIGMSGTTDVFDALVKIGDPAVKKLIEDALHQRSTATPALIYIGKPAVKPLIEAMKGEEEYKKKALTWILIQIGEPAIEPLISILEDPNPEVRLDAVKILQRITGEHYGDDMKAWNRWFKKKR